MQLLDGIRLEKIPRERGSTRSCRPASSLRGLVLDSEVIGGGVETIRFNFLPLLAESFVKLTWAVPPHVQDEFQGRLPPVSNLNIAPISWPATHWKKWASALQRRINGASMEGLHECIIDVHEPDFIFSTCIFSAPPLRTERPLFGVICDVNPVLPADVISNMLEWIERSTAVFAISSFTKAELLKLSPRTASKVHVLPLAAGSASPFEDLAGAGSLTLLYPATANGHKNHLLLFTAVKQLACEGLDFRLVLTGPGTEAIVRTERIEDPQVEAARQFFTAERGTLSRVIMAKGKLTQKDLAREFAAASALVLPSSYEGFGLPLAEGMAAGLPIICSDIPPYLEQLDRYQSRDRALIFQSNSLEGLVNALRAAIQSPRQKLSAMEVEARLRRWTWHDAAELCARVIVENSVTTRA